MFSFVPCVPAESTEDPRFPRPELRLPGSISPHPRQGKKIANAALVLLVLAGGALVMSHETLQTR